MSDQRAPNFSADTYLSSGPFGDSNYLSANTSKLYGHLGRMIASRLDLHVPLIEEKHTDSQRTILRRELDFAFAELVEGKPISNKAKLVAIATAGALPQAPQHLGQKVLTLYGDWSADPWALDVAKTFEHSMVSEGATIHSIVPSSEQASTLEAGIGMMRSVMPNTFFGTVGLAPSAVVVTGEIESAYINENPGAFLVNVSRFADPVLIAETVLHEALHEKMVAIRLTSNILKAGYDDLDSEDRGDVMVPWPSSDRPRYWSFARALAAYHVYVHTSVFYALAVDSPVAPFVSSKELVKRLVVQAERARYLHDALRLDACSISADVHGSDFLDWTYPPLEWAISEATRHGQAIGTTPKSWDATEVRQGELARANRKLQPA